MGKMAVAYDDRRDIFPAEFLGPFSDQGAVGFQGRAKHDLAYAESAHIGIDQDARFPVCYKHACGAQPGHTHTLLRRNSSLYNESLIQTHIRTAHENQLKKSRYQ